MRLPPVVLFPLLASAMLGMSATASIAKAAESESIVQIGVLQTGTSVAEEALLAGLRERGYIEGRNIHIEIRRSTGTEEQLRSLATDLAGAKVKLIVAFGSPATRAALSATKLPIVFVAGDPVATGFAASLGKPGGNATGVSVLTRDLEPKRLELLHQLVPRARRVGYLSNLSNPLAVRLTEDVQAGANSLGLQLQHLDASTVDQL